MGKVAVLLLYWPAWIALFAISIALGVWHHRCRSHRREKTRHGRGWAHAALDE